MKFSSILLAATLVSFVSAQTIKLDADANQKGVRLLMKRTHNYGSDSDSDPDSDSDSDSDSDDDDYKTTTKKSTSKKCTKTTKSSTTKSTTSKKCTKTTKIIPSITPTCSFSTSCTTSKVTKLWIFVFKKTSCTVLEVCPSTTAVFTTVETTSVSAIETTEPEESTTTEISSTETFPEQISSESITQEISTEESSTEESSTEDEETSSEEEPPIPTWILFHAGPNQYKKRELNNKQENLKNSTATFSSISESNGTESLTSAEGVGKSIIPSIGSFVGVFTALFLLL